MKDESKKKLQEEIDSLHTRLHQLEGAENGRQQTEDALHAVEEGYRLLFETNLLCMWVFDSDTFSFLAVNDTAIRHYGYSRDQFLSMTIMDIRPPEEIPTLRNSIAGRTDQWKQPGIWRLKKKDGSLIDMEISSHSLTFMGRRAELVMARDVTEQKLAQEAQRLRTKELAALTAIAEILAGPGPFEEKAANVMKQLVERIPLDYAGLRVPDDRIQVYQPVASVQGPRQDFPRAPATPYGEGVLDLVFRQGTPEVANDYPSHPAVMPYYLEHGVKSLAVFPIKVGDKVSAVLLTESQEAGYFTPDKVRILTAVTYGMGPLLETALLMEAQQQSEAKYRNLFENAIEGIYQTTPEGSFITVNPSLTHIFGYRSPEAMTEAITNIGQLLYVDVNRRAEILRLMQEQGFVSRVESQVYRKDRTVIWISETMRAERDDSGSLLYFEGTVQDITQRKQAEEALQRSEEEYHALFEDSPDAIFLTSKSGDLLDVNQSGLDMFGYTREEIQRINIQETYADPLERGRYRQEIEREGYVKDYEVKCRKKDGTEFDSLMTSTVRRADDASVLGYQTIIRDISQAKQAAERLKASEERFRLALDAAQMGTWEWDIKTDTYTVSERNERLLGQTPGSYDGTEAAFMKIVHPEDQGLVKQAKTTAIEQITPHNISYRIVRPDGSIRWIAATGQVYSDEEGNAVRMVGINRDITERKQAEETEQELRAIGEVARIVTSNLDIEQAYERFAMEIQKLIPFDKMSIVLVDETEGTWRVEHTFGPPSYFVKGESYPLKGSVMEHLIKHEKGIIFNDTAADSQFWTAKSFSESGLLSYIQVPLMSKDKVFGGVALLHKQRSMYSLRETRLLESLASHISPAIENSLLFQEVRQAHEAQEQKIRELTALNNQFQLYLEQREEAEDAYNRWRNDILNVSEEGNE